MHVPRHNISARVLGIGLATLITVAVGACGNSAPSRSTMFSPSPSNTTSKMETVKFTGQPALVHWDAGHSPVKGVVIPGSELGVLPTATSSVRGPVNYRYQWYKDTTAEAGATSQTFTPGNSFVGHRVSVRVIATDKAGNMVEAISIQVPVTNLGQTRKAPVSPNDPLVKKAATLPKPEAGSHSEIYPTIPAGVKSVVKYYFQCYKPDNHTPAFTSTPAYASASDATTAGVVYCAQKLPTLPGEQGYIVAGTAANVRQ